MKSSAASAEDISHVLARVIERDLDWTALPPALSPSIGTYLHRGLVKDPRQRIRDIGDVRLALEGAFETAAPQTDGAAGGSPATIGRGSGAAGRGGGVVRRAGCGHHGVRRNRRTGR